MLQNIPPTYYGVILVGLIATVTDFWKRKIYNWLTLPAILAGLALNLWLTGLPGLGNSFLGLLLGGGVFLILGLMGMMAGGDIKLAAAIGALIGWKLTISSLYYAAILGGIFAILWSAAHGTLWATLKRVGRALYAAAAPGMKPEVELAQSETRPMPYGVAISWGAITALFWLPPVF
ncbi:prepilin peptidase [bacterium (Candidatus Blackallbacteria) CG17_big_fil_post_rev_8_21_14_2_50_48_46]|uniref:Prepilin peptidase n=1 Tax=bacterium (Candidatus Blackallbacteria) CG17_big_fil_post_rev_8_21_14_2_50_48_46 TaxID=2014261 RepID=A0A2M7G9A3_9BACT|nr:MAG: prepilin peptidase [bacterium (Candidatus Blackallbacteria) CG18_big_fil_WC_8_21_14_2_50_49_26]PIW18677.1 MAG: prepilin peptidase [bacterium (Candidatus Blackallbacteria) CG17_big_fil_post_rev_8_21_14_2_50_48_46]PIW46337.1 MAG: prepilin peptidase [bacterium (Candidatus Blackallbacteria) CG13_big_fil_rev_8_21_14_2_50_49_14]